MEEVDGLLRRSVYSEEWTDWTASSLLRHFLAVLTQTSPMDPFIINQLTSYYLLYNMHFISSVLIPQLFASDMQLFFFSAA